MAVILLSVGVSSVRVSPLVTDHSNSGIRSWAATDCSSASTRSSSTVSMTISGWQERMRVRRSCTLVERAIGEKC